MTRGPRLTETAKGLWVVYVILTVACGLSLYHAGMMPWDAMMHAFSVMGLGGFSTKDASLGHFDSLKIEGVVIFFALLVGINYSTHFLALAKRSLRVYRFDVVAHYFLGFLALSSLGLTLYLLTDDIYGDFLTTFRYVAFHSVSLATSLGFATTDYAQWPLFAQLWILFLGSFVACSGSAGGGIKMIRAVAPGVDHTVTWTPGGGDARGRLTINANNSGHGAPYAAIIECDVADAAGQFTIAAALIDGFPPTSAWTVCAGSDGPPSTLRRYHRATAAIPGGDAELIVGSQLSFGVDHLAP